MQHAPASLIAVLSVLLLASVCLIGQTESGQISGVVTDTTNAIVPGAKVAVVSSGTGLVRRTTTNSAGAYSITAPRPDTYSLTVEHPDFQKYTRQVQVLVGSRNDVSAQLNVTGVSTTLEVTAPSETGSV